MNFSQLLSRADDQILQDLIGGPIVRLLRLIDPQLASPSRLRELLVHLRSPAELLRDGTSRRILFELLPMDSAIALCGEVTTATSGSPYQSLVAETFRRGSDKERMLFSFFGEAPPTATDAKGAPPQSRITPHYPLFTHQRKAVVDAENMLSVEPRRVLLHMPTGSGKTRVAMNIIADHLRAMEPALAIWLAYSEELCEQAVTEFEDTWSYLGNRDLSVYRFWGTHEFELSGARDGFLVAGLGKIYSAARQSIDFITTLADRATLVIIDEAHQAVAETYNLILQVLINRRLKTGLLGLSATPGRTWNDLDQDQELADFFNRKKVGLKVDGVDNPVDYLISEGYLARPEFHSLYYEAGDRLSPIDVKVVERSLDIPPALLQMLAEDEQRNLLIIHRVEQLASRHRRIIVFAATVAHARLIATVLRARGLDSDAITSETSSMERSRIITKFRNSTETCMVLCNYGVLTAGFDAPSTSAAVIARPTKSLVLYSQMVGRAIRGPRAGGNSASEIVTVVDTFMPGFGSIGEAFLNWEDVWT